MKRMLLTTAALLAAILIPAAMADTHTWDGSDSTAWGNGNNWDKGTAPHAGDTVIFPTGVLPNQCTVDVATNTVATVTINTGRTVTVTSTLNTSGDVTVNGTLTVNGTANIGGDLNIGNGGTVDGTGVINVAGKIKVDAGGTFTLGADQSIANLEVSGTVTTGAHTLTITASDGLTINSGGTITVSAGGTLMLTGGGTSQTINGTLDLAGNLSTLQISTADVTLDGSGQVRGSNAGARITIGDSKTLTSTTRIEGMLQILPVQGQSGTFKNDTGGEVRANAAGILLVQPTAISSGSGCWEVTGSSAAFLQIATTASVSGDFVVANASGTLDIDANVSTSGGISFTAGKIDVASGVSFTVTGTFAGTCPE